MYLSMYNSTPHSTTGRSPSGLFFNWQFRDKIPSLVDSGSKGVCKNNFIRDKNLTSNFNPFTHTLVATKGSEINVRNVE